MQVSDTAEIAHLVYWVGHRFDSWGIIVSFLAGEEIFLYSKLPMPVLVSTQTPVHWVTWHEGEHSCPFIVVLRLSVCVWSWTSTPPNACMARTVTTLQIPDCTENTGMYQVQDRLHHWKYISYISTVSTSRRVSGWPSERRQICSWWHGRVLFYKLDQYLVLLYT